MGNTAGICLVFPDGEGGGISFGSGANIDDLPAGDCTIEFWARKPTNGHAAYFLTKCTSGGTTDGWRIYAWTNGQIYYTIVFDTDWATGHTAATFDDAIPHHIALDWEVATKTARLFIDGVLLSSNAASGVYQSDAARDCICNGIQAIGTTEDQMTIGWIRLSNVRRYTGASFTPLSRIRPPNNDANTQLLVYMNEGAGLTAADCSGNSYDGTIEFGPTTYWSTWWASRGATWLHLAGVHEED